VQLSAADCASLADAGEAQVDLAAQQVRWPGGTASFEIDPDTKHRLLNGLDDIALTLELQDGITAYERERERPGPVTTAL
jgi:3-isopropylmalate/(R)-2-methylmalate dehydratase small subunit